MKEKRDSFDAMAFIYNEKPDLNLLSKKDYKVLIACFEFEIKKYYLQKNKLKKEK